MEEEIIDPYEKRCLYSACNRAFKAKRLNQGYCSMECKTKANNTRASDLMQIIRTSHAKHKLNRKILEVFYEHEITEVTLERLQKNKFDSSYPTRLVFVPELNIRIPHFYNYTLQEIEKNIFKITKL